MAESKIEEVARAIDPAAFKNFESLQAHCLHTGDDEEQATRTADWAHGHEVRCAMGIARAAIEAMRKPTDKMVAAGLNCSAWAEAEGGATNILGRTYDAMIDAALSEEVAG